VGGQVQGKNGRKAKKKRKSTVVSSKEKRTVMNPILCRMKKRSPSIGQNGQLVHWWLLVHSGHGLGILQLANSFASRQPTKTYGD
jgi:hypothetical protein